MHNKFHETADMVKIPKHSSGHTAYALPKKVWGALVLGVCMAAVSVGVLSQSSADAPVSISEVQAFIEQKVADGFPIDEVISSGLELGYRPELLAAVLMNLMLEPATIAVALANEGVPKVEAAKAVITVSGAPAAPSVLNALLLNAAPEEVAAITQQVTEFVATITTTTATTPASQETPAATQDVAVQTIEPEPSPPQVTEAPPVAESTTQQDAQVTTVVPLPITEPTPVVETRPPPPMVFVFTPPTPPALGGGGGATLN